MCFEEFMYFIEKHPFLKNDVSIKFYSNTNEEKFYFIKDYLIKKIKKSQDRCSHSYFKEYFKFSFNPFKRFKRKLKECEYCGKIF